MIEDISGKTRNEHNLVTYSVNFQLGIHFFLRDHTLTAAKKLLKASILEHQRGSDYTTKKPNLVFFLF